MRITGIIPARMNSTRFPGKALADILGIPMVIRVWKTAERSGVFHEIYVATDSPDIASVCRDRHIPFLMTGSHHLNPTSRTAEAASLTEADFTMMIGGDEPLLSPEDIRTVAVTGTAALSNEPETLFAVNAMAPIPSRQEALDPSNIKLQYNKHHEMITASRSLIRPCFESDCIFSGPSYSEEVLFRKFVSIGLYPRKALDFFISTPPSPLELMEHFDLLRFTEHGKKVLLVEISGRTLSVDTPSDLETVKRLLSAKKENHQIETKV
ncbi:MAG: NTP transferase domain-containing protein [Clostridium sp.]|nr:NTP transferase domain-containing protein [Clostridium sp.]